MPTKSPDLDAYFGQEKSYFSKSRSEWLPIEDMPFQQALFSHRKLLQEFGDSYQGTRLYQTFIRKLCPTASVVRKQLEKYGKACHVLSEPGPWLRRTTSERVRSKIYKAAGKKVTTHKVETAVGPYIEATVPVEARKAATKT